MALSQADSVAVLAGGITQLINIPQAIDNQFAPGDIAEFQLRLRFHVPGLEATLRTLLSPLLREELLAVEHNGEMVRIRWVRNLGPIAVAAIIVGVAIIVLLLVSFTLFKLSPQAAVAAGGFVLLLVIGGIIAFGFARRQGKG